MKNACHGAMQKEVFALFLSLLCGAKCCCSIRYQHANVTIFVFFTRKHDFFLNLFFYNLINYLNKMRFMLFRLSVIAGSERMNINEKRYCKQKQVRCRLKQFTQGDRSVVCKGTRERIALKSLFTKLTDIILNDIID